jgi:hypothetical protein
MFTVALLIKLRYGNNPAVFHWLNEYRNEHTHTHTHTQECYPAFKKEGDLAICYDPYRPEDMANEIS